MFSPACRQNIRNEEHATLVDYRARYVDTKFKCQELTRKLDASDAQLKRSRSLKSSCVGSESIENKSPPVGDEKSDLRDEAAEEAPEGEAADEAAADDAVAEVAYEAAVYAKEAAEESVEKPTTVAFVLR